jgi:hypothetical protein
VDDEKYDSHWWFGDNSFYAQSGIKEMLTGVEVDATAGGGKVNFTIDSGGYKEADMLKIGFMILGVYVIVRMVG